MGDIKKAPHYYELHLKIAKEVGDRVGEGHAFLYLGQCFGGDNDLKKALEYHEKGLRIAKEVRYEILEGTAYQGLGATFETCGRLPEAQEHFQSSVPVFNKFLLCYTSLWRILLQQDKIAEALYAAEEGRAQALEDLIKSQYSFIEGHGACEQEQKDLNVAVSHQAQFFRPLKMAKSVCGFF